MRDQILTYLGTQDLGSYGLSQELPFSNSGVELYVKNPKKLYVDEDQVETEVFMLVMNGSNIDTEITSVTVYFTNDAKTQPSDYDAVVSTVKAAQDLYIANGYSKRDVNVGTEYTNDLMTTRITIRFYKLIT